MVWDERRRDHLEGTLYTLVGRGMRLGAEGRKNTGQALSECRIVCRSSSDDASRRLSYQYTATFCLLPATPVPILDLEILVRVISINQSVVSPQALCCFRTCPHSPKNAVVRADRQQSRLADFYER